jgi:hypothetical protein
MMGLFVIAKTSMKGYSTFLSSLVITLSNVFSPTLIIGRTLVTCLGDIDRMLGLGCMPSCS